MAAGRHLRARSHRSWLQRIAIVTGALATLGCVGVASAVGYFYWKTGELAVYDDVQVVEAAPQAPRNYLIVGSDSRDNIDPNDPNAGAFGTESKVGGKRADTIMIARIDPVALTAQLVSFPRDLWVPIADTGTSDRINSAYGRGRQVLIDTIYLNFGIEINHYLEVDFVAFRSVVNAIGGVPMYFDSALRDGNTGLDIQEAGCVALDGDQALALARSRHLEYKNANGKWAEDPSGDLGRITRQQLLVRAALHRAFDKRSNPLTATELLDIAVANVGTDPSLDLGDLKNLANQVDEFTDTDLTTYSFETKGFRTDGGASVVRLVDPDPILNVFRGLPPGAVSESGVTVAVRNGSGVAKQATDVTAALQAVGFEVLSPGDAGGQFAQTTIRYAPGSEMAADLVARHLTSRAVLEEDPKLPQNQVTLITGVDFTTVMVEPYPAETTTTTTAPPTTAAPATTDTTVAVEGPTTTVVGHTPGEPPPGVVC